MSFFLCHRQYTHMKKCFPQKSQMRKQKFQLYQETRYPEAVSLGVFLILTHYPQLLLKGLPRSYKKWLNYRNDSLIDLFNSHSEANSLQSCGLAYHVSPLWSTHHNWYNLLQWSQERSFFIPWYLSSCLLIRGAGGRMVPPTTLPPSNGDLEKLTHIK